MAQLPGLTLRARVVLLVLAVATPLLALAGVVAWDQHKVERERADASVVALAHGTALLVDREFAAAERVLRTLAASGALARRDLDAFEAEMRTVAEAAGAQAINLIGPDGRVVRSTRLPAGQGAPVLATGPARKALATGRTAIGNLFIAPLDHAGAIGIAVPVLTPADQTGAPPAYVLGFLLRRERLLATLTEQRLPPGAVASVLDREHTIVARTRRDAESLGSKPPAEVVAAMVHGAGMVPFAYTDFGGVQVVAAYAQAPETGYWAKLILPAEAFEVPLRAALMRTAFIGAALLAVSLLLGVTLAGRLAAALRQLADPSRPPLIGGPRELKELAGTLTSWAARQDRLVAELRALFDGSPVGMVRSDAGGRVLDANGAFLDLVGMTRADLVAGRVRWDALTPLEWIGRDEAAIAEAIRRGGCTPYQKEYLRPDGTRVPVLIFFAFTDAATGVAAAFVVDLSAWKGTEAALALAHEQMRLAIGAARMFFWDWNIVTGAIEWSEGLEAACGLPPGGFAGTVDAFRALIHPADLPHVEVALGRALAGEAPYDTEFRMRLPEGGCRWVVARGTVQRDGNGLPVRMVGIDFDITERKAAETALRASEERFRSFAEVSPDVIYILDLATDRIEFLSPAFETIWGEPCSAILKDRGRWLELLHPEDRPAVEAANQRLHNGEAMDITYRIIRARDGEVRHVRDVAVPIRDATGQLIRISGIARDATARFASEQELAESRLRLQRALDELAAVYAAVPVGLAVVDPEFRYRHINAALAGIDGRPAEAHLGRTVAETVPVLWPQLEPAFRAALRGEATIDLSVTGRTGALAEERRWLSSYHPVRDAAGTIWGVGIAVQDVTDRYRAAADLAASEARFRGLAESLPAFVFVTGPDGQTTYANARMCEFVGRPATVLLGNGWAATLHPEDRVNVVAAWRRAIASGTPFEAEYRFLRHDGAARWFLCRSVPKRDAAGHILYWVGTCTDIDDLRQAESALGRAEEQLTLAIEGAAIGTCSWDLRTNLVTTSPRTCLLYGLPVAPTVAPEQFLDAIHPEDRPSVDAALATAMSDRGEFRVDYRVCLPDGSLGWRRSHGRGVFGPDGAALALHGVVLDIDAETRAAAILQDDNTRLEALVAERTRTLTLAAAELTTEMHRREQAQAVLVEAQKLEALGQLTGGIAHDFNNVLAAVMGSLRLIERRAGGQAQIIELARAGTSAATRAATLVRQLMAFARREDRMPIVVAPETTLDEARGLLRQAVGAGVRLEILAEPGTWPVLVDPHRLEVALLNLAANARDAMQGSGTIEVTTRNVAAGSTDEPPPGIAIGADHVVFGMRDTGPGMPEEVLARATEAFFTTKPRGQGTGLGLAMVQGFAKDSSGVMRIVSAPGMGTSIELWLPRAVDAVVVPPAPEEQDDRALHGNATVLVVDDDAAVRLVTVTLLRDLGYEVLEAAGSDAALIQAVASERLDLVVSDVTMPGGDGPEFITRLLVERPGVPVVYVSGYADRYPLEADKVLAKLFTPAELGLRVLQALGRIRPQDRLLVRLRRPELREAYVMWRRLVDAAGGMLPTPDAFDLAAMSGAANGFRIAVEGPRGSPGFRFLSMGAVLAARRDHSLVGECVGGDTETDEMLGGLAGIYERCARFGVPCHDFARYGLGEDGEPILFERLILPLAAVGATGPTQLVGIAYLTGSF
ncbi:PAS domain-containing protein [Belnapia rosea]|uniref:PAS domain-containing protein n=1 Tax=Belnapia rosea TaxID=938405 RepID=UPI000B84DC92|nr:PAS domain-containing protein [Belnapia rosea]